MASLKCEKQQVAALAEYLAGVLADLPPARAAGAPARPHRAGGGGVGRRASLSVAYDEPADRIVIVVEEVDPRTSRSPRTRTSPRRPTVRR